MKENIGKNSQSTPYVLNMAKWEVLQVCPPQGY